MRKYASVKFLSLALVLLLVSAFFAPFSSLTASADTAPKPTVIVTFEHMGEELCYGTLLSSRETAGPHRVWEGDSYEERQEDEDFEIWKAFVEYRDADGYYFLQTFWKCSETKRISWTYYPPHSFKILLYYPERNEFAVSGIYERYAFHSYFSVDMSGNQMDVQPTLLAKKSYNYTWELVSLLLRIVITIALELGVALLFRIRRKNHLLIILCTNAVTQIILNVALNLISFFEGGFMLLLLYLPLEILVFLVEAVVYAVALRKPKEDQVPVWKSILYAFAANALSFGAGFGLALALPGIF